MTAIAQKVSLHSHMRPIKRAGVSTLPAGFRSSFLDALARHEINSLVKAAKQVRISPHEVLQHEGEAADRLWLLKAGRVAVYRITHEGNKLFLRWGTPGDVFGLATIVRAPARYLVTIEGIQEGSILAWELAACQAVFSQCPSLNKAVNATVSKYLDDLIRAFGLSQALTAEERLARVLFESAGQLGHSSPEGIEVDLKNEELAFAAHVSLFTTARNLSKWQRSGLVKKYRGRIVLPSLSPFENIFGEKS